MIVEAVEPGTGKTLQVECVAQSEVDFRDLLSFELSDAALKRRISEFNISADAKSLLFTIAKTTLRIGSTVVKIGQKILDTITAILGDFPMASSGAVFGAIFGYLVASVPIIGFVLGPFVGALAIAFGFAVGATQDFRNKMLENRIQASLSKFESLKPRT